MSARRTSRPKISRVGNERSIAPAEILPRFLPAPRTGSLRRLSLDISSVPCIAAPPRGYLLANWTTQRRVHPTTARFPVVCHSRTIASGIIIYTILFILACDTRIIGLTCSNGRIARRRKRWPAFRQHRESDVRVKVSKNILLVSYGSYIFTFNNFMRDFDLSTIISSFICIKMIRKQRHMSRIYCQFINLLPIYHCQN